MQSEYLKRLLLENPDVGERYLMKLKSINDVDPFTLNVDVDDVDNSIQGGPPITNMDIVSYLVLTHSYYTKEQMKSYKSLQSYKYFESGFVTNVGTKVINDFYILIGKVRHSLRGNLKPLDVWCITGKDGSICTARCTCMAGNSEVCSHVGAILFAAEYANKRNEEVSCTALVASTYTQTSLEPVSNMDWGKPSILHENKDISSISASGIKDMLNKMVELGQDAVLMQIVEPFATDMSYD